MQLENNFHGGRSSRLPILRSGHATIFGASKMPAERSDGTGRSFGQTHRFLVQGRPEVGDGTLRAPPSDRSWHAIPAAVSAVSARTVAVLGACGERPICRGLLAMLSWIFEHALEGCAAYAAVMYGIPADELCDRRDRTDQLQAGSEHAAPLVSRSSTGISMNAKGDIPWLAESDPAAPEVECIAPPLAPRMGPPGWIASINSIAGKIRRLFDRRRAIAELQSFDDRRLRDVGIYRSDIEYLMRYGDRRE